MRKLLVTAVAALGLAVPANAATVHGQHQEHGFSRRRSRSTTATRSSWKNVDTKSHQVVANDGSFASPIVGPGKTYTHTFTAAGTFRYHDALHPSLTGTVKVKGPPPSVTFALSQPIVVYGTAIMLSGQISSHKAGQNVQLDGAAVRAAVTARARDRRHRHERRRSRSRPCRSCTRPTPRTGARSRASPIVAQVMPKVTLRPGGNGYMRAQVTGPHSFWHRHVFLQRLSRFGQWVNVASLTLGPQSGRLFRPSGAAAARLVADPGLPDREPGGPRPARLALGDAGGQAPLTRSSGAAVSRRSERSG